jgi:hypothetical protein
MKHNITIQALLILLLSTPVLATNVSTSISATTTTMPPVECIHKNKAKLVLRDFGLDEFKAQTRVYPLSAIDVSYESFSFIITDTSGAVITGLTTVAACCVPGELFFAKGSSSFAYKSKNLQVVVKERLDHGVVNYQFKIKQKGHFGDATAPLMAFSVQIGNDRFKLETPWRRHPRGWSLRHIDDTCD